MEKVWPQSTALTTVNPTNYPCASYPCASVQIPRRGSPGKIHGEAVWEVVEGYGFFAAPPGLSVTRISFSPGMAQLFLPSSSESFRPLRFSSRSNHCRRGPTVPVKAKPGLGKVKSCRAELGRKIASLSRSRPFSEKIEWISLCWR